MRERPRGDRRALPARPHRARRGAARRRHRALRRGRHARRLARAARGLARGRRDLPRGGAVRRRARRAGALPRAPPVRPRGALPDGARRGGVGRRGGRQGVDAALRRGRAHRARLQVPRRQALAPRGAAVPPHAILTRRPGFYDGPKRGRARRPLFARGAHQFLRAAAFVRGAEPRLRDGARGAGLSDGLSGAVIGQAMGLRRVARRRAGVLRPAGGSRRAVRVRVAAGRLALGRVADGAAALPARVRRPGRRLLPVRRGADHAPGLRGRVRGGEAARAGELNGATFKLMTNRESKPALLVLEDGRSFRGRAWGAEGEACGEVVFNTSMSGYQEVLTDPSYAGQVVCMTYPLIGNYGVNEADAESARPWVEGFVVREASRTASNWRSEETLDAYLKRWGVVAIDRVDTRALVRHIRERGAMRACISTVDLDKASLVQHAREVPKMEGADLVQGVTCDNAFEWRTLSAASGEADHLEFGIPPEARAKRRLKVAAYDFGVKYNILRRLDAYGCDVHVFPASAPASELKKIEPDGIFLSNGPGDPAALPYAINNVRELVNTSDVPMFGICLGHQILGLAVGGQTFKLKFGHRGANHPVKELQSGKVEITSQNHGFAVDPDSLRSDVTVTHLNLYDGTVEGFRHTTKPIFSVQYQDRKTVA